MHGDDDQIVPYRRLGAAVGQAAEERHAQDLQGPAARHARTHPDMINADLLAFITARSWIRRNLLSSARARPRRVNQADRMAAWETRRQTVRRARTSAPARSCNSAGPSAWARPRTHGPGARRSARTALRCAPSAGCGPTLDRPRSAARSQKLGQPVPLSNLVAELNSGSAQPAQTKVPAAMLVEQRAGERHARCSPRAARHIVPAQAGASIPRVSG